MAEAIIWAICDPLTLETGLPIHPFPIRIKTLHIVVGVVVEVGDAVVVVEDGKTLPECLTILEEEVVAAAAEGAEVVPAV